MLRSLSILLLLAAPAHAGAFDQHARTVNGVRIIEAANLSVAELLALAAEERENATRVNCCDWGGGGCNPALARHLMGRSHEPMTGALRADLPPPSRLF